VLEMATGVPPWSNLSKENFTNSVRKLILFVYSVKMSLLYHIGKTQSSPQLPNNISPDMIDFLNQCFKLLL